MDQSTKDEFAALENEARQYVLRMQDRREKFLATQARATIGIMIEHLQLGVSPGATGRAGISDMRAWQLTVQCSLQQLGERAARILVYRLGRRPKSSEASWERIASEVGLPVSETKSCYRFSVPLFVADIRRRGLGTDLREIA